MPSTQKKKPVQFKCTGGCPKPYTGCLQDVVKHMKSKKCGHHDEPLSNLFVVPFNKEGDKDLRICVHEGCGEVVNGAMGQSTHSRLKHGGVRILNRNVTGLQPTSNPDGRELPNENHYNDAREEDDFFGYTAADSTGPRFQYTADTTQSSSRSNNNNFNADIANQENADEEIFNDVTHTTDNTTDQTQNTETRDAEEPNTWNGRLRNRNNNTNTNRHDNSNLTNGEEEGVNDAGDDSDDADNDNDDDDETYTPNNDAMSEVNSTDENTYNDNNNTIGNNDPTVQFATEANNTTQSEEDKPFNYFRDIPSFTFRDLKEDIVTEIQSLKIKSEADFLDYYLGVRHLRLDRVWDGYKPLVKSLSNKLIAYYLNSRHLTRLFECTNTDSMEVEDEVTEDAIITAINNSNIIHDINQIQGGADNNNTHTNDTAEDNAGEEINREADMVPSNCYATSKIIALTAWLILPTLFRMLYKSKNELPGGNLQRYLKELDDISKPEYLAGMVITLFQKGRHHLIVDEPTNSTPNPGQKVKARIFDLIINKGHLSRGMQLIKRVYGTDITPEEGQISPEEFEAEVANLHPKRIEEYDDISELTHIEEIPSLASLTSTPSNLHHTIGSLKKDSTPGWDGWTFDLIRQLYLEFDVDDEDPTEDTALLLELMHKGLRGECEGQQLWNASKILLLVEKKSDGRIKKRPIAIPGSWTRLMSKVALSLVGDETGGRLAPLQLAVGIPDGISIGAKLLQQTYEDPEMTILSIDFSNAFNSVRRKKILQGLEKYCPTLIPFFQWSYAESTDLRDANGHQCCQSETGTRQGDPLSMLYFAVSIQDTLLKINNELLTLDRNKHGQEVKLLSQSYADDVTIALPTDLLHDAWDIVTSYIPLAPPDGQTPSNDTVGADLGLTINPYKCVAISKAFPATNTNNNNNRRHRNNQDMTNSINRNDNDILIAQETIVDNNINDTQSNDSNDTNARIETNARNDTNEDVQITSQWRITSNIYTSFEDNQSSRPPLPFTLTDNHKMFGVRIGTLEHRKAEVTALYKKINSYANLLREQDPRIRLQLTKYCINSMSTFYHRIEAMGIIRPDIHDEIVDSLLASIVDVRTLPEISKTVRAQPIRRGGLGIPRHEGATTLINQDSLRQRTISWLQHKGKQPASLESSREESEAPQQGRGAIPSDNGEEKTEEGGDDLEQEEGLTREARRGERTRGIPTGRNNDEEEEREGEDQGTRLIENADSGEMGNNSRDRETLRDSRERDGYDYWGTQFGTLTTERETLTALGFENGIRDETKPQVRKARISKHEHNALLQTLRADASTTGHALWLHASSYNGSGDVYLAGNTHLRLFDSRQNLFPELVKLRLLLSSRQLPGGRDAPVRELHCERCLRVNLPNPSLTLDYHAFSCSHFQRDRIYRHDQITNAFRRYLKKILPEGVEIETHPSVDLRRKNKGDIGFHHDNAYYCFDIHIANPVTPELTATLHQHNRPVDSTEASTVAHQRKYKKFSQLRGAIRKVAPVTWLATGRESRELDWIRQDLEALFPGHSAQFHKRAWRTLQSEVTAICQWHAARVRAAGNMLCTDRRRVQQRAACQRRQRERDAEEAAGTDRYRRMGDSDGLQRGRELMVPTRFVEGDGSLSAPTLTSTHVRAENLAERTPRGNPTQRASRDSSSRRRRRTAREAGIISPSSGGDSGDGARARRRARRDRDSDEGPEVVIPPSVEDASLTAGTAGGDSQEAAAGAGATPAPQQVQEGEGGDGLDDSEDGLLARRERRRPLQQLDGMEKIGEAVSNGIDLLAPGEHSGDQEESRLWLDSDDEEDSSKKASNSSNTDRAANWLEAGLGIQPGDQEEGDTEDEDELTPHQQTLATASSTSQAPHETTND